MDGQRLHAHPRRLILLGGALGDRFGRRRVFVIGVVWFAVASLLCGLAPNAGMLIAARALQGVGGALLTPGSLAMIQAVVPARRPGPGRRRRGRASAGSATAVGPFLGGWLVDGPGWRWVFLINVPLAAVCVPVAAAARPGEPGRPHATARFDVLGAALAALALAAVTYALIDAPSGAPGPSVGRRCRGGCRGGFVCVERRRPRPDAAAGDLPSRLFTAVNLVTLCVYAAMGGFFFLAVPSSRSWSATRPSAPAPRCCPPPC